MLDGGLRLLLLLRARWPAGVPLLLRDACSRLVERFLVPLVASYIAWGEAQRLDGSFPPHQVRVRREVAHAHALTTRSPL